MIKNRKRKKKKSKIAAVAFFFFLLVLQLIYFWFYVFAASELKDADIIWTSMQVDDEMKKDAGVTDRQYINQFPFEACLVMKHHLADTVQKVKDFLYPISCVELD